MSRHSLVLGLVLTSLSIGLLRADTPTVYVGDQTQHRIAAIATDATGNTYVTGTRVFLYESVYPNAIIPTEKPEVFIAKLDANTNERLWIRYFSGKDTDAGTAIGLDGEGNIYVGGTTTSPNFPLVNAMQTDPAHSFILKLSNDGSRLIEMGALFVGELEEDLLAFGVFELLAVALEEPMRSTLALDADHQRLAVVDALGELLGSSGKQAVGSPLEKQKRRPRLELRILLQQLAVALLERAEMLFLFFGQFLEDATAARVFGNARRPRIEVETAPFGGDSDAQRVAREE